MKKMNETAVVSADAQAAIRAELEELAGNYSGAKTQEKELKQTISDTQKGIISRLEALGVKSYTVTTPGGMRVTVTRAQKTNTSLDINRLKKLIGAGAYRKLLSLTFDKTKLDAAIKSGEITAVDVADASSTEPSAPYITLTRG